MIRYFRKTILFGVRSGNYVEKFSEAKSDYRN